MLFRSRHFPPVLVPDGTTLARSCQRGSLIHSLTVRGVDSPGSYELVCGLLVPPCADSVHFQKIRTPHSRQEQVCKIIAIPLSLPKDLLSAREVVDRPVLGFQVSSSTPKPLDIPSSAPLGTRYPRMRPIARSPSRLRKVSRSPARWVLCSYRAVSFRDPSQQERESSLSLRHPYHRTYDAKAHCCYAGDSGGKSEVSEKLLDLRRGTHPTGNRFESLYASRSYPPNKPPARRKMKCSSATMTKKNAV